MFPESKGRPAERSPDRLWRIFIGLFLALAVWLVFGQTRHFDFVNFDDERLVYRHPTVTQGLSWRSVGETFTKAPAHEWYPLTTLSHVVAWELFGKNAGGHHLINVAMHAGTALMLFLWLHGLTGALWRSAFVAAAFAIHPLRVESVAWVAERKDVLSGLFFVLTLHAYTRYAGAATVRGSSSPVGFLRSGCYWLALGSFALGLLSKTALVTLPLVLLLLDWWPLRRLPVAADTGLTSRVMVRPVLMEKIPFLLLSLLGGLATILAQRGAIHSVEALSLPPRFANAVCASAAYLQQMIYPAGLAPFYPHPGLQLSAWTVLWSATVLLSISVLAVAGWRKRPYLLVGWLWYWVMLAPVIGIIQSGDQARADRYTYLAHIGLCLAVAWAAADWCGQRRYRRAGLLAGTVVIVAAWLVTAHTQTRHWRDSLALWTHTLRCTPDNPLARFHYGAALAAKGLWPEAVRQYEHALQLEPDYTQAHYFLAVALNALGDPGRASSHFQRALELVPNDPEVWANLGVVWTAVGAWTEAAASFERALQLQPNYPEAAFNYGVALAAQGRATEARQRYERALALKPDYAEARNNLGAVLAESGRWPEAVRQFEQAVRLRPDYADAHNNLGLALANQGRYPEALRHYQQALELNPDYAEAHNNFAVALAAQGRAREAAQQFEIALNLAMKHGNEALADRIRRRLDQHQSTPPRAP